MSERKKGLISNIKENMIDENVDLSLIMAIVNRGSADKVVEEAKKAGAPAATIFYARGAGIKEAHTFFGLTMDPAREVLLFVVRDDIVNKVMQVINTAVDFDKPGTGIAISLKITSTIGLHEQIIHLQEEE